jgi:hypothetical protein
MKISLIERKLRNLALKLGFILFDESYHTVLFKKLI